MKQRAAFLALLLSGCTLGPDFHAPQTQSPAAWNQPAGDAAPSQPIAADPRPDWWTLFNDPMLTSLEQRLPAQNLTLAAADARLMQSRAAGKIVSADSFPTAGFNGGFERERASPNGILGLFGTSSTLDPASTANGTGLGPASTTGSDGSDAFNLWQYGFDASWEIDLWGKARREREAAKAGVEAAQDDERAVLVSEEAELARDYIELREIQTELNLTQQNLSLAQRTQALVQLRHANGAATDLDLANAGAELDSISAQLPALQNQQAALINAIGLLLGLPPRALEAELAPPAPLPGLPAQVPTGLPSALAQNRPDILAASARLHVATAGIGVAKADFYPQITLSGSVDIQALQFAGLGDWNSRQYGIGPTLSLPLFQGGRLLGTLQLRKAEQKQAAITYHDTVLRAWTEVDDALSAYNTAQDSALRWQKAAQESNTAFNAAQFQYDQGAADFLNVISAQARLLAAQQQEAQARGDADMALVGLYKALGGGWQRTYPLLAPKPGQT